MNRGKSNFIGFGLMMLGMAAVATAGSVANDRVTAKGVNVTYADLMQHRPARANARAAVRSAKISVTSTGGASVVNASAAASLGGLMPLWTFDVRARRDGQHHQGAMVGTNPFNDPGTSRIPTRIVPLILRTHAIASAIDFNTGIVTTVPGVVTIDPTHTDNTCLQAPNNVPSRLFAQSPIFRSASFTFGGTYVGTTQYIDAFQRANFYNVLGSNLNDYHVLLNPVRTEEDGVFLDVPANEGLAFTDPLFFGPPAFCAPVQIIDINWLDSYINGTLLPRLAEEGVGPSSLPIILIYNTVMGAPVNDLNSCCILGYHSFAGQPVPTQTYSVIDFDLSQFLLGPGFSDTAIASHEVGEWANDPYGVNEVPPWGHTGQVGSCQENLEVGDPLTGTTVAPVLMPNGFTYNLQEMAFFSWFFGGPSIGVNGWYSNNGTFTTDAGPICP